MTSLSSRRIGPLPQVWQYQFYTAVSETLFEMPVGLPVEQQKNYVRNRRRNVSTLTQLERFVEVTIRDPELKKRSEEKGGAFPKPYGFESVGRYFGSIPDFIKVVSNLSPRYEYNEHIQVFLDCCGELKLLGLQYWNDLALDHSVLSPKRDPHIVYDELVRLIRAKCLSASIRTAICQRRHEANERYMDYCRYIEACFAKHSRLFFLQLDLYYKNTGISDEATAERANMDISRILNNRRHNNLFRGWVGYVAKLEYGVQKRVHWRLLIWFDGRVRDASSHICLVEQFGEYWKSLTCGDGEYRNYNAESNQHHQRGRLGIGLIRFSDETLRANLLNEVLPYLTKTSQLLRPKLGREFKTVRRGQYPKSSAGAKRDGKRVVFSLPRLPPA